MQSLGTECARRYPSKRDDHCEVVPLMDRLKDALANGYIDQVSTTGCHMPYPTFGRSYTIPHIWPFVHRLNTIISRLTWSMQSKNLAPFNKMRRLSGHRSYNRWNCHLPATMRELPILQQCRQWSQQRTQQQPRPMSRLRSLGNKLPTLLQLQEGRAAQFFPGTRITERFHFLTCPSPHPPHPCAQDAPSSR
jgi:hypothetical protein